MEILNLLLKDKYIIYIIIIKMPEVACQTEDMGDVLSKLIYELGEQDDTILSLKKKLKNMTIRNTHSKGELDIIKQGIKKLCENDLDFKYAIFS